MTAQNKRRIRYGLAALLAGAVVLLLLWLTPWFLSLRSPAVRAEFQQRVISMGVGGVFFMLGLQVLQVVVAVLPGELIELVSGLIYGTWGGLLLCLTGVLIGSSIIFYSVRALGKGLVEWLFSREKVRRLAFLNDSKKLELFTFILFFLPGTPKDMLTYVAPLTKIRARDFFLISTFARIPSIVTSTFTGSALMEGNWWRAAAMFVLMGAIGMAGIWLNNAIVERQNKHKGGKK